MTSRWRCQSESDLPAIAAEIAAGLPPGDAIVHLRGDLGAGKTTLVRALATALGADAEEVASPTFTIVHEYPRAGTPLLHLDCYRLSGDPREWEEIGLPDILRGPGLKLIEWPPEGLERYAGPDTIIMITVEPDESRTIEVTKSRIE